MVSFNPVDKRTSANVVFPDGKTVITTKGAPQVGAVAACCSMLQHVAAKATAVLCLSRLLLSCQDGFA